MVGNEGKLRIYNRIIHLIFVGIIIGSVRSDFGNFLAFIFFMWGYDSKERLLLRVKYLSSTSSVKAVRRLAWNAIRSEVKLRVINVDQIGMLLETQQSKETLEAKGLSLVVLNNSLLAGWHGGMYPAVMRGESPPPGPLLFMFFILKMPSIDATNIEDSMTTIYARTRLPIPIKLSDDFCETQLKDFCETLAELGILDR